MSDAIEASLRGGTDAHQRSCKVQCGSLQSCSSQGGRGGASADVVDPAALTSERAAAGHMQCTPVVLTVIPGRNEEISMKDVVHLVLTLLFFGLSWLYVKGLERI
jgi:hypothetical protein